MISEPQNGAGPDNQTSPKEQGRAAHDLLVGLAMSLGRATRSVAGYLKTVGAFAQMVGEDAVRSDPGDRIRLAAVQKPQPIVEDEKPQAAAAAETGIADTQAAGSEGTQNSASTGEEKATEGST